MQYSLFDVYVLNSGEVAWLISSATNGAILACIMQFGRSNFENYAAFVSNDRQFAE
jgi:hypothetical protein